MKNSQNLEMTETSSEQNVEKMDVDPNPSSHNQEPSKDRTNYVAIGTMTKGSKPPDKGKVVGLNVVLEDDFRNDATLSPLDLNLLGKEFNFSATEALNDLAAMVESKRLKQSNIEGSCRTNRGFLRNSKSVSSLDNSNQLINLSEEIILDKIHSDGNSIDVEAECGDTQSKNTEDSSSEKTISTDNKLEVSSIKGISCSDDIKNMKKIVLERSYEGVKDYLASLELNVVYDSLTEIMEDKGMDAIKEKICGALVLDASLFKKFSRAGLLHSNHDIKSLTMLCLLQIAQSSEVELFIDDHLINALIDLIKDSNMGTARLATSTLCSLVRTNKGGTLVLTVPEISSRLKDLMKDECRFGCFEVIVAMATKSDVSFEACASQGLLDPLLHEIQSPDIWIKANVIELITPLATSAIGMEYLEGNGILNVMDGLLYQVETSPMVSLLLPNLISFFGQVVKTKPKYLVSKYSEFLGSLCLEISTVKIMSPHDRRIKDASMKSMALMAMDANNRLTIFAHGDFAKTLKALRKWLLFDDSEMVSSAMTCLDALFKPPVKERPNGRQGNTDTEEQRAGADISTQVEQWFDILFPPNLLRELYSGLFSRQDGPLPTRVSDELETILKDISSDLRVTDCNSETRGWSSLNMAYIAFKSMMCWPTWGVARIRKEYPDFWDRCLNLLELGDVGTDPINPKIRDQTEFSSRGLECLGRDEEWKVLFLNMILDTLGISNNMEAGEKLRKCNQILKR